MFGSPVLEVGIGLAFFYLLLSVMCSAIYEWIAGMMSLRGENLRRGLRNLFYEDETDTVSELFFSHPLIKSLAKPSRTGPFQPTKKRRPSYIPPRVFASVLLDMLNEGDTVNDGSADILELIRKISGESWMNGDLEKALTVLAKEAGNNLDRFRENLEVWYQDCMDRVSGWYKRKSQAIIFAIAVGITFAVNADTITVVSTIWNDSALRGRITALAESALSSNQLNPVGGAAGRSPAEMMKDAESQSETAGQDLVEFPIGWNFERFSKENPRGIPCGVDWLTKIIGLLVTTFSVSLGAPFWFDLLGKLIQVRSSIQAKGPNRSSKTDPWPDSEA